MQKLLIQDDAIYPVEATCKSLGMLPEAFSRARRLGHVRAFKRGGKWFLLGKDLKKWLDPGPEAHHAGT